MDRYECIRLLMAAGVTWWMAACYFHDQIEWRHDSQRREVVEHLCGLAREDAQLRNEE